MKTTNLEHFYITAIDWLIVSGPRILAGIIILVIGFWLVTIISKLVNATMHEKNFNATLRSFLSDLIALMLRILVVIVVMETVGLHLTIFSALIASMGVAFGLALSGTLQNFASGVFILILKPFEVGDNILAQGIEGTVSSIQIFFTMVTTFDNKTVIFPNSKLSNEMIINITRTGKRRLDIHLKLNYSVEESKVKEVLSQTVASSSNILKNPASMIGISELQADGYMLMMNVWVDAHGFENTKLAIHEKVLQDLKNNGIKLPGMV